MTENLITPTDLTNYAPDLDLSAFSSTTISGMISRASSRVVNYCEVDGFFKSAVTNERGSVAINPQGDLIISFRRRPVAQGDVSAIRVRSSGFSANLPMQTGGTDIYLIPEPRTYMVYPSNLIIANGWGLLGLKGTRTNFIYEIDYTGGYDTIPDDIKEAVTLFVREVASRRSNPMGVQSFTQGALSMNFGAKGESQLVTQAKDILNEGGYKRQVIF